MADNYNWGATGKRVQSGQGVQQPTILDYTLLPFMASMMKKREQEAADARAAFPALIAANALKQDETGPMSFLGSRWSYSPGANWGDMYKQAQIADIQNQMENFGDIQATKMVTSPNAPLFDTMEEMMAAREKIKQTFQRKVTPLSPDKRSKARKILQDNGYAGTENEVDVFLKNNPDV